jgi:hypothetical protein
LDIDYYTDIEYLECLKSRERGCNKWKNNTSNYTQVSYMML